MKTKKQKQEEAKLRQEAYDKLSTKEKLKQQEDKGFIDGKQFQKLNKTQPAKEQQ